LATDLQFVDKPASDPTEILLGQYQLQIRPAQEYATVLTTPAGALKNLQSFDVNDRLTQGITLFSKAGSLIADGNAFVVDDGSQVLTFEFNKTGGQLIADSILINVTDSDTAAAVAVKISNAINSAVLNRNFKVRAATALSNGNRIDLFDALSVSAAAGTSDGLASTRVSNTVGDTRPVDAPGQTIIQNSTVTQSRQVGILVAPKIGQVAESRLAFGSIEQFPIGVTGRTGSIANVPISNTAGLVPGITIKNNLVTHSGRTGIMVSGDPNASYAYAQGLPEFLWGSIAASANLSRDVELFLPFVRVLNNTVYDAKVGIAAVNASSPTIMNNIVANVKVNTSAGVILFGGAGSAIYVDSASGSSKTPPAGVTAKFGNTVVTANLYQDNSKNVTYDGSGSSLGSLGIEVAAGAPLFVKADEDNFYLVSNSVAIDSSVDSLLDRPQLTNIAAPLGIAPSAILAPELDIFGQRRIDDPQVDPPTGVGGNVFKDRGAIERSDFSGPTALLVGPVDNSTDDRNSLPNQVTLLNALVTEFAIRLEDGGVGIDTDTVDESKFVVQRTIGSDTTTLVPNVDYIVSYDTNAGIVRLIPAQSLWLNGIYTITLRNANDADPILDLAGNALQANAPPATRFVIELTDKIVSPWQNPNNPYDVNNNGSVTGADLLILINRILTQGTGSLPIVATAPPYYDVTGDGALRTSDLLAVVNYILTHSSAAPLTAVATDTPAAEPQAAPAAEPMAEPAVAQPLAADASDNVIATALTTPAKPVEVSQAAPSNAGAVTAPEAASPRAIDKAMLADAPQDEVEVNGVDRWDEDLDSILSDLSGDLQERAVV
jgi:parallel beta-helix repeat protein